MLLEHPGQLVTREELRNRIWPADTFVDFEQGLYNAVRRLREALRDSAEKPRLIETLSRRGYRFIGTLVARSGTGVFRRRTDRVADYHLGKGWWVAGCAAYHGHAVQGCA